MIVAGLIIGGIFCIAIGAVGNEVFRTLNRPKEKPSFRRMNVRQDR